MNFIKSQLLGIHLLILCDEIGHIHKAFLLRIDVWWLSWGKALVQLFELQAKLATFLKLENCFTWKAKYHFSYSDLSSWKIFYQKSTKGACHCKGNNWEVFVANDKITAFKQKFIFLKTCIGYQVSRLRIFLWGQYSVFNESDLLDVVKWSVSNLEELC